MKKHEHDEEWFAWSRERIEFLEQENRALQEALLIEKRIADSLEEEIEWILSLWAKEAQGPPTEDTITPSLPKLSPKVH